MYVNVCSPRVISYFSSIRRERGFIDDFLLTFHLVSPLPHVFFSIRSVSVRCKIMPISTLAGYYASIWLSRLYFTLSLCSGCVGTDHYSNKCRSAGAMNYGHCSSLTYFGSLAALWLFENLISKNHKCQTSDHPNWSQTKDLGGHLINMGMLPRY